MGQQQMDKEFRRRTTKPRVIIELRPKEVRECYLYIFRRIITLVSREYLDDMIIQIASRACNILDIKVIEDNATRQFFFHNFKWKIARHGTRPRIDSVMTRLSFAGRNPSVFCTFNCALVSMHLSSSPPFKHFRHALATINRCQQNYYCLQYDGTNFLLHVRHRLSLQKSIVLLFGPAAKKETLYSPKGLSVTLMGRWRSTGTTTITITGNALNSCV